MTAAKMSRTKTIRFDHAGFACVVVFYNGYMPHWCGYVRVPEKHPCYKIQNEMDVPQQYQDVHGGVTFSGTYEALGFGWWLGFDCNHSVDWAANSWNQDKITQETKHFAEVLAANVLPFAKGKS
jgi:hypothetical protein